MRPAGKARRPRISGIFEGGATPPDGMQRRPNAKRFLRYCTKFTDSDTDPRPAPATRPPRWRGSLHGPRASAQRGVASRRRRPSRPGRFRERGAAPSRRRTMSVKVPMTRAGFLKLSAELERMKRVDRQKAITDIAMARGHGDITENAEYDAAKERQAFVEGRIREIEHRLANAQVIDTKNLPSHPIFFPTTL